MNDVVERLAKIETGQSHLQEQLDKVIGLLSRMVKVEENIRTQDETIKRVFYRIEKLEDVVSDLRTSAAVSMAVSETRMNTWKLVLKYWPVLTALGVAAGLGGYSISQI